MKLPSDDKTVKRVQYAIYVLACLFVGGIIAWIAHLLSLSWELQDVPSASIGISIVAIPLFSTLFGIFSYVFWGLMRNGQ
jgi:hypothetical protein